MWQRYTIYDVRVIAHYLGVLIIMAAAAMLIPLAIALVYQEWSAASRYLLAAGITWSVGTGLRMLRIEPGKLNRQQALAVTGLGWLILGLLSAVPLAWSGHYPNYYDALFDSVSAYSATGVSIVANLDHLSNADNMWRFVMHFCGGIGLIVVAMSLGVMGRSSTTTLYAAEGRSEHIVPNVLETAQFILKFSLFIIITASIALTAVLIIIGIRPDRAVLHSIWLSVSGFMTAGFAPMSSSIAYYHSIVVEWVLMLVMLIGGINFSLHGEVWRGRTRDLFKDIEVRTAIIWWAVLLITFMASLSKSPMFNSLTDMMRSGMFNFISAATTTGFVTLNTNQINTAIPSGAALILAMCMAIGTSAGSTSGGIKLMRLGIIAKSALETMRASVTPDTAAIGSTYNHIGTHRLDSPIVKESMTVFILFIVTYTIGALVGVAYGYDAISAIFESVAMASNSGITAGISSTSMPLPLETVYIIEMWAGRLEFVAFLALAAKIFASLKPPWPRRRAVARPE